MPNYTWRVYDVAEARFRAVAAGASNVTQITADEFGDQAISLSAPDGYFWTLVEQR